MHRTARAAEVHPDMSNGTTVAAAVAELLNEDTVYGKFVV
jgi:hypothetical protein